MLAILETLKAQHTEFDINLEGKIESEDGSTIIRQYHVI